ncbi:MAG TPA: hypothetical protein VIM00_11580 [Candidatus Acidoferrum sp.]|jgi:type II secretory pathway pseudopilin PulG
MKNKLILPLVLLLTGFLLGFIPERIKASRTVQTNQDLRLQLETVKKAGSVNSFRNRAALLYIETEKNNFSNASERASALFTDLRQYQNETADPSLKQNLEELLKARDAIIAGLAKADPAVTAQIQKLFLKMQEIQL